MLPTRNTYQHTAINQNRLKNFYNSTMVMSGHMGVIESFPYQEVTRVRAIELRFPMDTLGRFSQDALQKVHPSDVDLELTKAKRNLYDTNEYYRKLCDDAEMYFHMSR